MAKYRSKVSAKAERFREHQEVQQLHSAQRVEVVDPNPAEEEFHEPSSMEDYHDRMAKLQAELREWRESRATYYRVRGRMGDAHRDRDAGLKSRTDLASARVKSLKVQMDQLRVWYAHHR
jgi:hypothetical protein